MPPRLCRHGGRRLTCQDCRVEVRVKSVMDEVANPPADTPRPKRKHTPVPRSDRGPTIQASFESECGECFGTMYEGDEICPVDGVWMHAECADEHEG